MKTLATGSAPAQPAARAAAAILETVPPTMRAIRLRMREGRPTGLSVSQFRALLYIRRNPGTGLSEIAEFLGTTLPASSELVTRLVRQGLVFREPDEHERRRIRLTASEEGAEQLADAQQRTLEWLRSRLEGLDERRLDALVAALGDLAALVADKDKGAGS